MHHVLKRELNWYLYRAMFFFPYKTHTQSTQLDMWQQIIKTKYVLKNIQATSELKAVFIIMSSGRKTMLGEAEKKQQRTHMIEKNGDVGWGACDKEIQAKECWKHCGLLPGWGIQIKAASFIENSFPSHHNQHLWLSWEGWLSEGRAGSLPGKHPLCGFVQPWCCI